MSTIENILGGFVAAGAIGLGGYSAYKNHKTAKKLDISMRDLEKKSSERISQDIVDAAVMNAANKKADEISSVIKGTAIINVKTKVNDAINSVVGSRTEEIKNMVDQKLSANDIQIDKEKLSKDIYKNVLERVGADLYNDMKKTIASLTPSTAENSENRKFADAIEAITSDEDMSGYQKQCLISSLINKM